MDLFQILNRLECGGAMIWVLQVLDYLTQEWGHNKFTCCSNFLICSSDKYGMWIVWLHKRFC